MVKGERRKLKGESKGWLFFLLTSAFCLPLFGFNNLSVERRAIRAGETVLITLSLEDDFAEIDDVRLPVHNLTIDNPPSVALDYSLINGTIVRRKILRYRARGDAPGMAVVGPLVLNAGGQRDTLPAIAIEVVPDRAATSTDPQEILGELLATGREPLFILAQRDKESAYVGEQTIVTWYLYNGTTVQQWQIGSIPKLDGFWVEELDIRSAKPETLHIGETMMQKLPIRRVALYPLRAGRLEVGALEVEAAVMRGRRSGPFAIFEGNLIELSFSSAPIYVSTRAIPAGPPVAAVGDLAMRCLEPQQRNGGPVVIDAVLTGTGNLRAAEAPRFAAAPAGEVQRIERGVTVQRSGEGAVMTRRWQFQIFPRERGTLKIPELRMPVFSTTSNARQTLQCSAATLLVTAAQRPVPTLAVDPAGGRSSRRREITLPWIIAGGIAALFLVFVLPWWRRRSRLDRSIRGMIGDGDPARVRENVHASLEQIGIEPASLLREATDRGDAYRALRSLLDALERDRIDVADRRREMRRRIRELLVS